MSKNDWVKTKESDKILPEKGKGNQMLIIGLVVLLLVVLYWLLAFSSYLSVPDVEKDDYGGTVIVQINTNAAFVTAKTDCDWLSFVKEGKSLYMNIDENNSARDRIGEVFVSAGLVWGRKTVVRVRQKGKGATYLRANPDTFGSISHKGGTVCITVETDGDVWNVVSCPYWITSSKYGYELMVNIKENEGSYREGSLKLESYNKSVSVFFQQNEKPRSEPQNFMNNDTGVSGSFDSGSKPPKPERPSLPTMTYPTKVYTSRVGSFSSFMVVDRELSANEADAFLNSNPGWRFETRDELLSLYQNYEYALPNIGEGYWYYLEARQDGGYDLCSLAYNEQGKHDSNEYRNRVILVK